MATHYEILGIDTDADRSAIKKAYFKLCRIYHPDVSGDENGHFFKLVTAAYETLSDEKARARYDQELNEGHQSEREYTTAGNSYDGPAPASEPRPQPNDGRIQPSAVDFGKMDWYNKDYSEVQEKIILNHPHMLWALGGTAVFVIGTFFTGVFSLLTHAPFFTFVYFIVMIAALVTQNKFARFKAGRVGFTVTMAAWAAGHIWSIISGIQRSTPAQPFLFVLIAFVAGLYFLGIFAGKKWRSWSVVKMDRGPIVLTAKQAKEYDIWGKPGELSDAIDKFGQRNVALGALGEKRTAELLANLFLIPGTKVFHGLKFPGSETADVDHAVVNGGKIAFIDSKMWAGGHYSWTGTGSIVRDGYDSLELYTHFPDAVDKMEETLFHEAECHGWIMIHSNDNRTVMTDNSHAEDVRLGTPQECLEEIGNWFADGNTGIVNRGVLNALIYKLK